MIQRPIVREEKSRYRPRDNDGVSARPPLIDSNVVCTYAYRAMKCERPSRRESTGHRVVYNGTAHAGHQCTVCVVFVPGVHRGPAGGLRVGGRAAAGGGRGVVRVSLASYNVRDERGQMGCSEIYVGVYVGPRDTRARGPEG